MADKYFEEQSSGSIVAKFKDRNGALFTPTSITWTLTDTSGDVINEREQEEITAASSVEILLSGDDLEILDGESSFRLVERRLVIEAVYDSDLGTDLPLRSEYIFYVKNLRYIT